MEEYNKHQENLAKAKEQLKGFEQKLSETEGPKKQAPIKEQIQRLKQDISGHEKEIRQKWPEGPQNE